MEAEAGPSMEAQLQALRDDGPPPGMSHEEFEQQMAQYEQAMQDPAVRSAASDGACPVSEAWLLMHASGCGNVSLVVVSDLLCICIGHHSAAGVYPPSCLPSFTAQLQLFQGTGGSRCHVPRLVSSAC